MSKGEIIKGYSGVAFFEYTSWCHRYKVLGDNGKVKYLKLKGFQTEDEAVESYYKYKELFEKAQREFFATVDKNIIFKDYLIYWFEYIYSKRITPNSRIVGAYIIYDLIIPNIEYDLKINMVTTDYLDEIIERCSKMTESGGYSTRNMIVMAMKDAVTSGYITYNPSLNTKFYRRPKPKIRILSEEQIKRLLAEAKKTNWYLEILLGLFVGLRKGEILGLKTTDFNEENKTVRVERQIVRDGELVEGSSQLINYKLVEKTPKTDNSIRCLKVPDLIIEELNKRKQVIDINKLSYGENYQNNDYISCQSDGNCHCLGAMNSALTKLCNKLSLPHITVHGLRHMCATILLEEGVSLAKISAMLGHTSIHTTFEYYCEVMDEKEKILAFMNNLFSIEDGVEYVG
jgi:integrase